MKQVVFLKVNHRGPLPSRELHSTDETIVWRDPGGSWACLWPVSEYEWFHPARVCDTYMSHTCKVFVQQVTSSSLFLFPWIRAGRGGGGGGGGGTHLFPITNGSHTSTWSTSELNNDQVLGNNTWTCGLRIKLKHYAWGYIYISCHWLKWQPDYISLRNRK